jgi:signal transduction histidine kinase
MSTKKQATRKIFIRYAAAAASVAVGLALRLALIQVVTPPVPYITFFPAIMFSAWFGGIGPTIFSSILTIAIAFSSSNLTFHNLRRPGTADAISAVVFLAISAFIGVLTEELRQSRARSEERLEQLEIEMARRVKSEEELKRINEKLTRANGRLEEFTYISSHDLRDPLRMVQIYTDLLLRELGEQNGNAKQYARALRDSASRMEALLRDLQDYSQTINADELSIGTAILTVSLSDALSILNPEISETGALVITEALPTVRGETSQISHVFQNLLSNAIKYRKAGLFPQIRISAKRDDDQWIISVSDNGIGFEPQYGERIFGLFKRLHKDSYPGTGLGLAICQRIVERYGGRIWAESKPGEGATFHFSLPCSDGRNSGANLPPA